MEPKGKIIPQSFLYTQQVGKDEKKYKVPWYDKPDFAIVRTSNQAMVWRTIFVTAQITWLICFPVDLLIGVPGIVNPKWRTGVETSVDVVYILNIIISPFIEVYKKNIDVRIQKKFYPVQDTTKLDACERRPMVLF